MDSKMSGSFAWGFLVGALVVFAAWMAASLRDDSTWTEPGQQTAGIQMWDQY